MLREGIREHLPQDVLAYIHDLETRYEKLETRYDQLVDEYRLLAYKRFVRSSEKIDVTQTLLFNEAEQHTPRAQPEEDTVSVPGHTRKKRGRKPLDEKLPREVIVHDIPDEEKQCGCGNELEKIGEEVSERLTVIPEQIYVERHVRPKYACKRCEGSGDEEKPAVRIAPAVPSIIPKSIVTPGLLAFLLVNKYIDHLPFYRQEKRFERIGVHISRQVMSSWQWKVYEALGPLFDLLTEHIKTGQVLQMDETTVQVMNEPGRSDTQKSYMWLARGGPPDRPVVLYEYRETRGSPNIVDLLEGFSGYLQTDGYEGYKTAVKGRDDIVHVGCFAHARRKFFEASKASKKAGSAEEGLTWIQKLYALERELRSRNLDPDVFVAERKKRAGPILDDFNVFLLKKVDRVPPKTLIGKAVRYTLGEWNHLIRYLDSFHLTPDNNAAENAIRPFVLGRKNWLFAGSPYGAESSCGIYSLLETAKLNGLNPYSYLYQVFEQTPLVKTQKDWQRLLPWNLSE